MDEELKAIHGERVNDDDWKFLSNYWRSPEPEVTTSIDYLCSVNFVGFNNVYHRPARK
ncbi:hypothetical protein C2845_PM10G12050 [Panicum miliaceum]|uniref:Uncharacterized protein n=1 Tax=Panicum miliaceum TaxID=4540 RepID=A0A3L6PE25_PANMI|nr:hypothetical protein C2845_PM10G12050 [Panicum miliaceum]